MSDEFDTKKPTNTDNNWAVGVALILIGGLFLLDTFNIFNISMHNWWAIFILIPGLTMAARGIREYQDNGDISSRNSGFWGVLMILFAFTLFFGISWNLIFPIGLVGVGLYLLLMR
jgi:hypothetical protein